MRFGLNRAGENHQPARFPVQSVHGPHPSLRILATAVLALSDQPGSNSSSVGCNWRCRGDRFALGGVAGSCHPGRLLDHDQVLIEEPYPHVLFPRRPRHRLRQQS